MDKAFMDSISIEKFAAFLDGNLQPNEMQQISSIVENDDMMHDIFDASKITDETLANYTPDDLILPEEITSTDFELPSFEDVFQQSGGSFEDCEIAACACADVADISEPVEGVSMEENTADEFPSYDDASVGESNENSIAPEEEHGDIFSEPNEY